mmetsp:Transcript_54842/g.123972  ORF Transcript_54842/g.123972 Transcript_54842/m.123972 type:complete len:250 (-) Transcript_54842:348-1097(-)
MQLEESIVGAAEELHLTFFGLNLQAAGRLQITALGAVFEELRNDLGRQHHNTVQLLESLLQAARITGDADELRYSEGRHVQALPSHVQNQAEHSVDVAIFQETLDGEGIGPRSKLMATVAHFFPNFGDLFLVARGGIAAEEDLVDEAGRVQFQLALEDLKKSVHDFHLASPSNDVEDQHYRSLVAKARPEGGHVFDDLFDESVRSGVDEGMHDELQRVGRRRRIGSARAPSLEHRLTVASAGLGLNGFL